MLMPGYTPQVTCHIPSHVDIWIHKANNIVMPAKGNLQMNFPSYMDIVGICNYSIKPVRPISYRFWKPYTTSQATCISLGSTKLAILSQRPIPKKIFQATCHIQSNMSIFGINKVNNIVKPANAHPQFNSSYWHMSAALMNNTLSSCPNLHLIKFISAKIIKR